MEKLPDLPQGPLKEPAVVTGPVAGFKATAAAAGIKYPDRNDLALIAADRAVPAAGVFTRNLLAAAQEIDKLNLLVGTGAVDGLAQGTFLVEVRNLKQLAQFVQRGGGESHAWVDKVWQ